MDVILREDVQDLGRTGDVVAVSPGYARNFLIPQNLAIEATRRNLRQLGHQKLVMNKRAEKQRAEAATLVEKLGTVAVTVEKPVGKNDRLYGSVTGRDVVKALAEEGYAGVGHKKVVIDDPIRQLGIFDVPVRLSAEHSVQIKVWVVAKA